MEVRRLSPDSLWIEMPLSAQTCLRVWQAMAECGLKQGKINSFLDVHFEPLYDWQKHIVEGRTAQGLFDPQAKIQAQLQEKDGGTLLKFLASNVKHDFDFGSSWREKRRLIPKMKKVLAGMPLHTEEKVTTGLSVAPIASPHSFGAPDVDSTPSFEPVPPLIDWKSSLKSNGQSFVGCLPRLLVFMVAAYFGMTGPLFIGLALWEMWRWRKDKYTHHFVTAGYILFCLGVGIRDSWTVIRHWF